MTKTTSTGAQKIAEWRAEHPDERIDGPRLRDLLGWADLRGASLRGADLQEADLEGADLRDVDLRDATLWDATLRGADLGGADLGCADLGSADLWGAHLRATGLWRADLRGANFGDADMRNADLWCADLRGATLRGADLRGANLGGANLDGAGTWGALRIDGLPSGQLTLIPTPDGWDLRIGCWRGTPDALRALIDSDEEWPEARGDEVARRRPLLAAALALIDAHTADQARVIADLAAKWGR